MNDENTENTEIIVDESELSDSDVLITTVDNPFDPFNDFDNWYRFDVDHGYYTWSKVCRLADYKDSNSEQENDRAFEAAIDRLVEIDFLNLFKKVKASDYTT